MKKSQLYVMNLSSLLTFSLAYIDEIYNTMASAAREGELEHHRTKLKEMAPPPINTIFEKQPRGEAIQKRDARLKIATQDIPPTNPGIIYITWSLFFVIVCDFK